jgi:hypothetical protein
MTLPAGVCRFCGCSEYDACCVDDGFDLVGCSWTDRTRSVCSVCAPAAKAEAIALRTLAKAGYRSERPGIKAPLAFVAAFHQGFVVGWFGISPRSPYSRNPFTKLPIRHPQREAWDLGHWRGAEASRVYQSACGPLTNAPRKAVLQGSGRR